MACGSRSAEHPHGGGDAPPDAPAFTVGGTVTGLVSDGLVLAINGGGELAIASDGPFTFATPVALHAPYHVTVMAQPAGERCDIAGGDGVIEASDVTSVVVTMQATTR